MRKILLISAALACLFSASGPASGASEAEPVSGAEKGPYAESGSGIVFPEKIGSLTRTRVAKYKQEEYGINIAYSLEDSSARADLYVYGSSAHPVPNGSRSKEMRQQFEGAVNAIFILEKKGIYKGASLLFKKEQTLQTSDYKLPALWACLEYTDNDSSSVSHILMTGYRGKFLKVRFSYKKELGEKGEAAFNSFLAEFAKLLKFTVSREELLAAFAVFDEKPFTPQGLSSMSTILCFAENSKEVEVILSPKLLPWLPSANKYKFGGMVTGAYVAGNVKAQLDKSVKGNDSLAGLLQALKTYRQSKDFDKDSSIPELDSLAKLEEDGKLKDFVAEALKDIPKPQEDKSLPKNPETK